MQVNVRVRLFASKVFHMHRHRTARLLRASESLPPRPARNSAPPAAAAQPRTGKAASPRPHESTPLTHPSTTQQRTRRAGTRRSRSGGGAEPRSSCSSCSRTWSAAPPAYRSPQRMRAATLCSPSFPDSCLGLRPTSPREVARAGGRVTCHPRHGTEREREREEGRERACVNV